MKTRWWQAFLTLQDYKPEQSIREKIFCSFEVSNRNFHSGSSPPLPPCYLRLTNSKFASSFNPTQLIFSAHHTTGFSRINLHDTNHEKYPIFLSPFPGCLISTMTQDSFYLPNGSTSTLFPDPVTITQYSTHLW